MGSASVQGQLWGRTAHDWAELQEPLAVPLWEAMLDAAMVGRGARLLDAGCGAGGASSLAAGRGAQVNGLDASPALLAIARERVPDGDFQQGDLEALPYAEAAFDAVIAADVLTYVADPVIALRELRRVCRPRGRVVLAIWDAPEHCAQHAILTAVAPLLPHGGWRALGQSVPTPGLLDLVIGNAGLTVIGGGAVTCLYQYPDREIAWQAQVSAGPLQAALLVAGKQRLKATVDATLALFTTSTGSVSLPNRFLYTIAAPREDDTPWEESGPAARLGGHMER